MSDSEFEFDSDQEISENHSKLVNAVRGLDKGQRVEKLKRSEPSLEISEFHVVKSGTGDQDVSEDLPSSFKKKVPQVLPKPLEKPAAERIKRVVGFENTRKELGKWAGIIARNRTAASLSFPISQSSLKLPATDEYLKRFCLQSELEKKLAELEPEKEPEEEKDEFPLTLEEILERRKEAAKFRAQQSYKEAKAHRQNKIKSKKYHRIQRKERMKKALKEFEELQKTDPQAALEKLDQLDKARAEERMTLRHKSTGQWAKSKLIRAKYDKESQQVLAEQLAISRDLTQKVKKDDSEEEDDDQNIPVHLLNSDKENPWMNPVKNQNEIEEFVAGYRKYWDERNKSEKNQNKGKENDKTEDVDKSKKVFEEPEIVDMDKKKNPVEQVIEEYLPGQNGFTEHNKSDESENEVEKKPNKKLQKSSKNKLGIKIPKTKNTLVKKSKVKVGTTSWSISPVDSTTKDDLKKDIDIDDMFDSVEDKIQEKLNRKLSKMKRMLDKETKKEQKNRKKRRKDDSVDDVEKLGLKGQRPMKPIIDKPIEESASSQPSNENLQSEKICLTDVNISGTSKARAKEIDPNKFMNMKSKHINTLLPDAIGGEEGALDDDEEEERGEEDQHQIISEAFADDDVVDEFRKEKEEEIKKSLPKDVDMRLPGWGSWGGKDIKTSTRRKSRLIVKFPKQAPRRDENKGDVVIIEEKCPKIKKHLVSDLPFPFTTVQDYEASMRAPIGRDFVPEKTFSKLIQPAIKTKMGKVIEPMSEEILVNVNNMKKKKKKAAKKPTEDKEKNGRVKKIKGSVVKKRQINVRKSVKSGDK